MDYEFDTMGIMYLITFMFIFQIDGNARLQYLHC